MLGHLDEHTVESLAQFVHLLIALLVVLVLHHFFKIYKRLLEGLAQLLVDTRIHLILDVRLLALVLLLHLHALEVEFLLLVPHPHAQQQHCNENIGNISPPCGIERRTDDNLQSALGSLLSIIATDLHDKGVSARGKTREREIRVVGLGGYPVVAQSFEAICELHIIVGKPLVDSHLNGKLAFVAIQHKAA